MIKTLLFETVSLSNFIGMEDDDEFGDLYTDVLHPFSTSSQPHQTSPAPSSLHRPIDLNLNYPHPASVPNSSSPQTLKLESQLPSSHAATRADKDCEFTDNNHVKGDFDIEEEGNNGILNDDDGPGIEIPGISQNDVVIKGEGQNVGEKRNDVVGEDEEDDWESDSEDDLQIVLNEENHRPMLIDEGGGDEDDEDGDPLVILADGDASNHQGLLVEEQEWGGDDAAAQMGEGGTEKEGTGVNGVAAAAATVTEKIGYSNHFAYHNPYHSQFKYVRPGTAPILGSATVAVGGAPGQVRPLVNMGVAAGRGRGDWRPTGMKTAPPMQKGFHPSFGMSASGVNMTGRGLEFTLPSHKTIFDVDIDGFEENPWKYPGVDISDFFNFGLNEESWKAYCKQLEQHRLETTMQSKIRVYESGWRDQEYDPDLPPELAAATGILDVPADNANLGKSDVRQSDLTKGPPCVRPPIPTGRAIQVEDGFGERLPSIDTRPPRIRDSDAIIEIVCQDSVDDDSSTGNGDRDNDLPREDHRGKSHGAEDEMGPIDTEYFDGFPEAYDSQKRELVRRGAPFMNVVRDNIPEGNRRLPFPPEAPDQYRPGSRGPTPKYPSENIGTSNEQRRRSGRKDDRSLPTTPIRSPQIKKFHDNQDEVESMEGKCSLTSSPATVGDARELSIERKDAAHHELVIGYGSSTMEMEETNTVTTSDNCKDGKALHSLNKQKINSQVEQFELQKFDEEEDSRAARSSENSKARSGSSIDHKKWRNAVEEEVMQDGRSTCLGSMKNHLKENEQNFRRKDQEGRQEMERTRVVEKGREGSYPHRDFDPSLAHDIQRKSECLDWRKERENSDGFWQRREDELYSRKNRIEDTRKREHEHLDEIRSRHRSKARESERTDRDEYLHSRKQLDNGSYRLHYDKDAGPRHRERVDSLKGRYEMVDDYISKRGKDEYIRRDHAEKDEILHGHQDLTSRRKRERDDILDLRRREDQQRTRENFDDRHPVRHKDECWLQRESGERQREREEWHRLKSHEEILPKRERGGGRGAVRSGRSSEDRAWVGHAMVKDEFKGSDKEYQLKDTVRRSEQVKRREKIEDENLPPHRGCEDVYTHGNQFSNEERKSRKERSGPRNDHAANSSDNVRVNEKKHKESSRKNRESEVGDHNSSVASKRNQEDQSGHVSEMGIKGTLEQGNGVNEKLVHRNSSRKHKEEASSDDEKQDSRRGRSKLERWTIHKERDFSINSKSSASLKFKEINKNNSGRTLETTNLPEEPATEVGTVDKQRPLADKKGGGNPKIKGPETKPADDRHLDTVEKLKKRSERFKLPLPSEKDTLAIKKMESEPLPSTKSETPEESEIKQERPARKRRWISS